MLTKLSIRNYALIDRLDIDFNSGFSTITGETGAGKSIILGALGLVLGERADTSVIADGCSKCVIEVFFSIEQYDLKHFFTENELDYDSVLILRREILSQGKSRAFINDTPTTLSVLNQVTSQLIDIHSQHETLAINQADYQLEVIDAFAENNQVRKQFSTIYSQLIKKEKELKLLIDDQKKSNLEFGYFQFLFDELEATNLTENEQQQLENELKQISHAEEIKQSLHQSIDLLEGNDSAILSAFKLLESTVAKVSQYADELPDIEKRINSLNIEIQDIAYELSKINDSIDFNENRLNIIHERLSEIYTLQKKHKVSSVQELLAIHHDLEKQLTSVSALDDTIQGLKSEIEKLLKEANRLAEDLSEKRKRVLKKFENEITALLQQLGMESGYIKVNHEVLDEISKSGKDKIEFLFTANKGKEPRSISKVASGGELSRLMLSVKYIFAKFKTLPTILFDEIDTGVSGDIADKMGEIMREMAKNMQVITITHLPQIASKGKNHYCVYKSHTKNKSTTEVKLLNEEDRLTEIAKMLSGNTLSEAAYENAKELLKS